MTARQLSLKKYLLLKCQILALFANILAANDKYPVLNRVSLTIPVEMQLSQKQKTFSEVFSSFLSSSLNFDYFEQKITLIDFVFPKLRTPKTWLDKCLKSPVSEDPANRNIVNEPKNCCHLHHSTITIFNDHCEGN